MRNFNTTKKALIGSVIALLVCFTMLLGTTFAWFTDSATSANNKISSGNLDIDLYLHTEGAEPMRITEDKEPIFDSNILWEPGRTEVVYLSIKNNGTLDMKYKVALLVVDEADNSLTEVMEYAITPDATLENKVTSWDKTAGIKVNAGLNDTEADGVVLPANTEHFFALSVHMNEEAGNDYMLQSIAFDIQVVAGQLASEADSFGTDYDADAEYAPINRPTPTVSVTSADELYTMLDTITEEVIIDATGVTINASATGERYAAIPAGVTIKGATLEASGSFLSTKPGAGDAVVFEDCVCEAPMMDALQVAWGVSGEGEGSGVDLVFNNCVFSGWVLSNGVETGVGTITFNNCTFGANGGTGRVQCQGGITVFNNCTFNYPTTSHFTDSAYAKNGYISVCSETNSHTSYSAKVYINDCTGSYRTMTAGPNSSIVYGPFEN